MVHKHSKLWARLLGLSLALAILCGTWTGAQALDAPPESGVPAAQSVSVPDAPEAEAEEAEPVSGTEPSRDIQATGAAATPAEQDGASSAADADAGQEDARSNAAPEDIDGASDAAAPAEQNAANAAEPPQARAVEAYSGDAAIYYLADPAGDPWTNDTGAWAPAHNTSSTIAQINTKGATWVDGYVGQWVYKEKNIKSNVASYITQWPDGSTGSTWTVRRGDTATGSYFTAILDSIWNSYRRSVQQSTGISDLEKDDVSEITLTPRKISRDNGGNYEYHIDCALSIKCTRTFTAKFWVMEPGAEEYEQRDAKNYPTGSAVQATAANIAQTLTVDGRHYVFDGWYVENDAGNGPGAAKVEFPATPTQAQLADGTVNYYAHYTLTQVDLTVEKQVTGAMGDKNRQFSFTWSCGTQEGSFTLSDGQRIMLENLPVGAELTLTETNADGYAISLACGGETRSADSGGVMRLTVPESACTVTVTNHKDVIPDTGLALDSAPYVLLLGLSGAGGALLRRRRHDA